MAENLPGRRKQVASLLELVFFRGMGLEVSAKELGIDLKVAKRLVGFYKTKALSSLELTDFVAGLRFRYVKRMSLWEQLFQDAEKIHERISILSQIRSEDEVLHKALGSLGLVPKKLGEIDNSINVSWDTSEEDEESSVKQEEKGEAK